MPNSPGLGSGTRETNTCLHQIVNLSVSGTNMLPRREANPQSSSFRSFHQSEIMIDNNPDLRDLMEAHGIGVDQFPHFWKDPLCLKDFRWYALKRAIPRVAVALLVWMTGVYCNNLSQAWLQTHLAGYYNEHWPPKTLDASELILWDAGYKILPTIGATDLVDDFAGIIPGLAFIRFAVFPGPLSMRYTFLCRILFLWGILWALRGITIISTVLPNPDKSCKPKLSFPDNIFLEALANMPFAIGYNELTCQDVLFSGHSVALTLATISYIRYMTWAPYLHCTQERCIIASGSFVAKTLAVAVMFAGYFTIIASKFHYTVDVIIGAMMTLLIFQSYHSAVRVAFLPQSQPPLPRWCSLYPFIRWFDKDARDVAVLKLLLLRQQTSEP